MSNAFLRARQVEKEMIRSAKNILAEQGLNPSTKRGNKELTIVVKRLASTPCNDMQLARDVGITLGEAIVALSQKLGKTHLDQGIIQQLSVQDALPSLPEPAGTDIGVESAAVDESTELEADSDHESETVVEEDFDSIAEAEEEVAEEQRAEIAADVEEDSDSEAEETV